MKQILNKYLSLLFFIGFIVNTSYAGGKESESSYLNIIVQYRSNEPMKKKNLVNIQKGVLSFKYTYY